MHFIGIISAINECATLFQWAKSAISSLHSRWSGSQDQSLQDRVLQFESGLQHLQDRVLQLESGSQQHGIAKEYLAGMGREVVPAMSPAGSPVVMVMAMATASEDKGDLIRRGPWMAAEDMLLVDYVANHGEGRWNSLARCSGLRRTGKSCRLRWMNYLRPDVRRGNITPEEQLLILDLHSRWGNRWSKIAQRLVGRTDNEVKNYWRTKVQNVEM